MNLRIIMWSKTSEEIGRKAVKGMRNLMEMVGMFIILTVVMVSLTCTFAEMYQIVFVKYVQLTVYQLYLHTNIKRFKELYTFLCFSSPLLFFPSQTIIYQFGDIYGTKNVIYQSFPSSCLSTRGCIAQQ